jgi:UDP-2-acetamido-2-deoxy-ribo-hexuluronate aminotransferase
VRCPTVVDPNSRAVFYVYVIEAAGRDQLAAFLASQGVETEIYYPRPVPLQPCFANLGHVESDFPTATAVCQSALALPLHPDLSEAQVSRVCDAIRTFYARDPAAASPSHVAGAA